MFDEIRDFVVKNKIWFIICGIIFALAGAVMTALISLYFLIAVAVGVIVAVASGCMKKVAIPIVVTPEDVNQEELKKYKEEARKKITPDYVQTLSCEKDDPYDSKNKSTCSILIQDNGNHARGFVSVAIREVLRKHFHPVKFSACSLLKIRGDIEVFFEVLTGVDYNNAVEGTNYKLKLPICLKGNNYSVVIPKCFFEHTILCASTLYKNQYLLKFDRLTSEKYRKMFPSDAFYWYSNLPKPLLDFEKWDTDHKHGAVLKSPDARKAYDLLSKNLL